MAVESRLGFLRLLGRLGVECLLLPDRDLGSRRGLELQRPLDLIPAPAAGPLPPDVVVRGAGTEDAVADDVAEAPILAVKGKGVVVVTIAGFGEGAVDYGEGTSDDASVTMKAAQATWAGLASGDIDSTSAYMSGDLVIEGNLQDAIAYGEVLGLAMELGADLLE